MQGPQGTYVYVVDENGMAQPRPVTLGLATASGHVMNEGLAAGDRVIVEGVVKVRPGQPVRATTAAELAAVPETESHAR